MPSLAFFNKKSRLFWPNSSKHLLCPLMLEGPISSVYHLLLLLPPHYFGPTFCQLPFLFGSKRNIQESLLNIGIKFCFWFHLSLKLPCVTYFVWCQALRNKTATFDKLKLATKQILLMSPYNQQKASQCYFSNIIDVEYKNSNLLFLNGLKKFLFGFKSHLVICWT